MKIKLTLQIIIGLCSITNIYAQNTDLFLADPTIFYDQGKYYLYGTEKSPQKGFPVYESTNQKQWKPAENSQNGYALLMGNSTFGTKGFWAPQIFHYNKHYYMAYTANENIAIAESDSPTGPFIQKTVKALDDKSLKIDPFVFFDEDGKIYLYHVRLNHGNTIWVAELSSDLSEIKNNTLQKCISPTQEWENRQIDYKSPPISEGPTVIKHKGTYYLFYSANDFRSIYYAVGYATAPTPTGPWTKFAGNPLISRENIGMNGTGHGDVFFDKQHKMHYVFHTHNNDSTVQTRRTYIVNMKFTQNGTGNDPDRIVVSTKKIMKPELISKQK